MTTSHESPSNNYRYIAREYYSAEHETCRSFEDSSETFFRDNLVDLAIPLGGIALDVGSGGGLSERYLGEGHSDTIVEVDMHTEMLRQSVRVKVRANALALPFADSSFDKASAFLFDPYNHSPFESEVIRVLRPGGVFIGTLPSWDWASTLRYIEDIDLNQTRFRLTGTNTEVFVPSFTTPTEDLKKRFQEAGFADVKLLPIYTDTTKPVSKHIKMAAQLLRRAPHNLEVVTCIRAAKL